MSIADKVLTWEQLSTWRAAMRAAGKKVVATNGCFDLLHRGHCTYLAAAKQQGDVLLVGVNSDASVKELKGPDRPINDETDRAFVLAALASVDAVCIFRERRAVRFLEIAQPDIYVKGGDYTVDQLPKDELQAVESHGGRVVMMPGVPGRSTTGLLAKIAKL